MKKGEMTFNKAIGYGLLFLLAVALFGLFNPLKAATSNTFSFIKDKIGGEDETMEYEEEKYCFLSKEEAEAAENLVCCRYTYRETYAQGQTLPSDVIMSNTDPNTGMVTVFRPRYLYADIPEEKDCKYMCGDDKTDAMISDCKNQLGY